MTEPRSAGRKTSEKVGSATGHAGEAHAWRLRGGAVLAALTVLLVSATAFPQETACAPDSGAKCTRDHGWILGPGGPMYTSFNRVEGAAFLDGDIRVKEITAGAASAINPTKVWAGGVVPYVIHPDLPAQERVFEAIAEYHEKTSITLVPRTNEEAFVEFVSGTSCWSYVGKQGKRQEISLNEMCGKYVVIHEIGHAIGLWHEQNRHDRDEHIIVHWNNIDPGQTHNFDPYPEGSGVDFGPYDFASIMHYPPKAFSRNGEVTIEPRNPLPPGVTLGPGTGLSEEDVAGISALYGAPPEKPALELENGIPVPDLSASTARELHFMMEVPVGTTSLDFNVSGGTGDADLYVRFGSPPTPVDSTNDCASYNDGTNNESCVIDNPPAGTWYAMIYAYRGFSGATLVGGTSKELKNGVHLSHLTATYGEDLHFTMQVPANVSWVNFQIFGGTGDADLYVKYGGAPNIWSYDCSPYITGNVENCLFDTPIPGTWHIVVRAYSEFSELFLVANYEQGNERTFLLATDLAAPTGRDLHFSVEVPEGVPAISFDISGGTGDADLYVRFGNAPSTRHYHCRPYVAGNSENCKFTNPIAGTWHVMVRAWSSFNGVALQGSTL